MTWCRTLTVDTFDLRQSLWPGSCSQVAGALSVFEVCYQTEMTEATVQTYRDKLMYLRKLDSDVIANHIPLGDSSFVEVRL